MRKVHLLTTGQCERLALPESLSRLFPNSDVEFVATKGLTTSFTSAFIGDEPAGGLVTLAEKFANELVATVDASGPNDIVIGIDDLELENVARPEAVLSLIRRALVSALGRYQGSAHKKTRLEEALRARCSFHLLVPMLEAYFFGEPEALLRAGAQRQANFDPSTVDLESFVVRDQEFIRAPDADATNAERRKRSWAKPGRERHPKLYLKFLCSPDDAYGNGYRETHEGVAALRSLAWQEVLSQANHAQFARSLLADLSDALDVPNIFVGKTTPLTSTHPREAVLRNL